jgi:hypothetical protein
MDEKLPHSDLPDLRKFLDELPRKPCPSKLPEEYCKICRRLNKDVAHYCKTKELPEKSKEDVPIEDIPLARLEPISDEEEKPAPPSLGSRNPILDRPSYKDGDTSLEFISSQRSIEEARKSLPRFIPVNRGPRTFRPLEDETDMEFETFSPSRSSIFKEPSLLSYEEDDMMFSLAVDDDAIEVMPVEVLSEGQYDGETVYSDSDGIVEVVDIPEEEGLMTFEEEDVPAFEFMTPDEGEYLDVEIIEAEVLEDEPTFETFSTQDSFGDSKSEMEELADEITDMTESLEAEFSQGDLAITPDAQEVPGEEPATKLKRRLKPKKSKKLKKKVKKLKKKETGLEAAEPSFMPDVGESALIEEEPVIEPHVEEIALEPVVEETVAEEPVFKPHVEEPKKKKKGRKLKKKKAKVPEIETAEPSFTPHMDEPGALEEPAYEPQVEELEEPAFVPQIEEPKKKSKKKMKLKIKKTKKKIKKSKKKDLEEPQIEEQVAEPEFTEEEPAIEEPVFEPDPKFIEDEPFPGTEDDAQEEPLPIEDEPFPEVEEPEPVEEPLPIEDEPFPEVEEPEPVEEPLPIEDEPFPDIDEPETVEDEPFPEVEEPEPVEDEPFPETDVEEPEPVDEEPFPDYIVDEPEPIEEEPFPETDVEEPEPVEEPQPIEEEPFPDTEIEEPEPVEEPPPIEDEPFPETDIEEPQPIEEEPAFTPLTEEPVLDEIAPEGEPVSEETATEDEGGAADLYMCPSCGAFVSGSASVCIKCGYDFNAEENGEIPEQPEFEPFDEVPPEAEGELPIEDMEPKEEIAPDMEFTADEEPEKKEEEEPKPKKKKKKKVKLKKKKKVKLKKVKKKKSED